MSRTMDIVLIPGLWLDGSSWDQVVPALEKAGHRPHPITLPGLESVDSDRSQIGVTDHVDAVVRVIDSCDGAVLLVGHSLGCAIATAVLDARTDKVARALLIGGFPAASGKPPGEGFTTEGSDLPFPGIAEMDEADLADMDAELTARFVARAIPSPARLTTDVLELHDQSRHQTPIIAICPEYTAAQLRQWIAEGMDPVAEFPRYREVEYVDLPTGHWPQFTKPDELAEAILAQTR